MTKRYTECQVCLTPLKLQFQFLIGFCNWCLPYSEGERRAKYLELSNTYAFDEDPEDYEGYQD